MKRMMSSLNVVLFLLLILTLSGAGESLIVSFLHQELKTQN